MAAGGHFEKKIQKQKLLIDLKWQEMRSKVIFGHPKKKGISKMDGHFKKIKKKKVAY